MFFGNIWMLMTRVKSQHCFNSPASNHHQTNRKGIEKTCFLPFSILSAATVFGMLITISVAVENISKPALILSFLIAALISILSGICVAECLTMQPQGPSSIYICLYQGTCEILAYVIGWTWLLSLCAQLAILCRFLSSWINIVVHQEISRFLKDLWPNSPDIFAFMLCIIVILSSLTGLNGSVWWFVVTMPFAFFMSVSSVALKYVSSDMTLWKNETLECFNNFKVQKPEELLIGTVLCSFIFIGAHNLLRAPHTQIHRRASSILGRANFACLFLTFPQILSYILIDTSHYPTMISISVMNCVITALIIASLCLLALEHCHPILTVIEDMASDGLIFRSLCKKWKPFCKSVPALSAHLLATIITGALILLAKEIDILKISASGLLFINFISSVYVLVQRYYNEDSWQYEPLLQNSSEPLRNGRQRLKETSTEFLPQKLSTKLNGLQKGENSDSESESSETDVDAVVNEYKEQVQMTKLTALEMSTTDSIVKEPTEASAIRAKIYITGVLINYLAISIATVLGLKMKIVDYIAIFTVAFCLLLSFILMCFLQRLPQRKLTFLFANRPPYRVPLMPWLPGITVLLSLCLLVYVILEVWQILLCWISTGLLFYFIYGIRNSTAARSFFEMSSACTQVELQPLPNLRDNCLTTVIPAQRRLNKPSKHTK